MRHILNWECLLADLCKISTDIQGPKAPSVGTTSLLGGISTSKPGEALQWESTTAMPSPNQTSFPRPPTQDHSLKFLSKWQSSPKTSLWPICTLLFSNSPLNPKFTLLQAVHNGWEETNYFRNSKEISEIIVKTARKKWELWKHCSQYKLSNSKRYKTKKIKLVTALHVCYRRQPVSSRKWMVIKSITTKKQSVALEREGRYRAEATAH